MTTETELKLALQPRVAPRVMTHPVIEAVAAGPARRTRLLTVYYDTPQFDLWAAQVSIRLRRTQAGWLQTVKWGGAVIGGLHQRQELELAVSGQAIDFDAIVDKVRVPRLGSARFRRRIRPVFVTEFERTTRMLQPAEGGTVELCLDRGHIVAGTARMPICELELELKGGSPLGLFDVAQALVVDVGLRPVYRSKAERGYLLAGLDMRPIKAPRIVLDETLSIAQSAARIVASGLEQIQANEDGVLAGKDIEYLHQMRVGVRRLRSCFGTFARIAPAGALDAVRAELKWFGGQLGPARDWDVF
ncbi:MAG: inorganic triphosphatase, partial [Betaproteobacteria bacterium]